MESTIQGNVEKRGYVGEMPNASGGMKKKIAKDMNTLLEVYETDQMMQL